MPSKKDIHIVPHGDKWAVRRENSDRVSSTHPTQTDAYQRGHGMAERDKVELVTHRRDGTIRDSDSFGNDPARIKDRKH